MILENLKARIESCETPPNYMAIPVIDYLLLLLEMGYGPIILTPKDSGGIDVLVNGPEYVTIGNTDVFSEISGIPL